MSYKIEEIEGIGNTYGEQLTKVEITTTEELLKACCDPKGRKTMAEKTGISEKLILKWTNMADLMRVSGVGKQFAELLEVAGVDTVKELKMRVAANLAKKMNEVNAEKKLNHASVNEVQVQGWIDQAKEIPPMMTY